MSNSGIDIRRPHALIIAAEQYRALRPQSPSRLWLMGRVLEIPILMVMARFPRNVGRTISPKRKCS
jgi:hypothetical protein